MPQLRQDPIAGYWVAIAEDRAERPIDFTRVAARSPVRHSCPFCPGNEEETPPEYLRFPKSDGTSWRLRVVPNRYPALTSFEGGQHEVIIDSDQHLSSFSQLPEEASIDLLAAARLRFVDIKANTGIEYVQLFKNNGAGSGASLEHPHSQLLGLPMCPPQVACEVAGSRAYAAAHGCCGYCEYHNSAALSGRLIFEDAQAVVLAPYAPRFAYETWVIPKAHASHFEMADEDCIRGCAVALHRTFRALDSLLDSAPLNFLLHTAPVRSQAMPFYHWHIEVLPRLSGIGGYEFGTGCYINTVPPERAAAALRGMFP